MKQILLLVLGTAGSVNGCTLRDTVSFDGALSAKVISADIKANGGHNIGSLIIELRNLENHIHVIKLEAGRTFDSKDNRDQDLILTKDVIVHLGRRSSERLTLDAYCAQRSNRSPATDAIYLPGIVHKGEIAEFLSWAADTIIPAAVMQTAIWTFTDGHRLPAVSGDSGEGWLRFMSKLAELHGEEMPWYQVEYLQKSGIPFTNRPIRVKGDFQYTVESETALVTIILYSAAGSAQATLMVNRKQAGNHYILPVTWDVKYTPHGDYFLRCYQNGEMKTERMITI